MDLAGHLFLRKEKQFQKYYSRMATQLHLSQMFSICKSLQRIFIEALTNGFEYLYNAISNMGMLDDTLIVITTDHGHSLGENNYLGKRGYTSTLEVFDVPVLLRNPSNEFDRGKFNNMLIQHTDITATILDILGIDSVLEEYIDRFRRSVKNCYKPGQKNL